MTAPKKFRGQQKNLVRLTAFDLLAGNYEEYTWTIGTICSLLKCTRNFVARNILPEVPHIFLNFNARKMVLKERGVYLIDYYYFRQEDVVQFLTEHCTATRQTISVPFELIAPHKQVSHCRELYEEYLDFRSKRHILTFEAGRRFCESLRPDIRADAHLASEFVTNRSAVAKIPVSTELPTAFRKYSEIADTSEAAYRSSFLSGRINYHFEFPAGGSLSRLNGDFCSNDNPVLVYTGQVAQLISQKER